MKKHIQIDPLALEHTIDQCQHQLNDTTKKYHTSMTSIVLRFLLIDLRTFLFYSFSILLILFFIAPFSYTYINVILPIYFFILGLLCSYEYYKNQYYQTTELVSPVYIHPGRQLLIKVACIALIELGMFAFLATILHYLTILHLSQSIMMCFVPLFTLQLFVLQLLPYIKNYISSFIIYIILYSLYSFIYNHFLFEQLSLGLTLCIMISILILYLINLIHLYQITKIERTLHNGINTRTCQ